MYGRSSLGNACGETDKSVVSLVVISQPQNEFWGYSHNHGAWIGVLFDIRIVGLSSYRFSPTRRSGLAFGVIAFFPRHGGRCYR